MPNIQGLIFSKDRPLQLDGTLRSFSRHCRDAGNVALRVLYVASTSRNRSLYRQLMREHPHVQFVEEFDFRRDSKLLLALHEFVLLLVDDCLFVGDFVAAELAETLRRRPDAIGVSLRLGRNTTYCYAHDKPQRVPDLQPASASLLEFRWPDTDYDFSYPLEVSSSLYRSADLRSLVDALPFRNPNTLEAELANHAARFRESHPVLLCPGQSLAFCAPVNLVQQVCANRAGSSDEMSASTLADKFAAGWRMDASRFDGFIPTSCHQDVELPLAHTATSTPLVSVIMPCYKQDQFLRESVESVVAQTFTDWELIIVDDGSPDDTAATAHAIIAEHPGHAIRLLQTPNRGVSEARNAGIRMARGAYILPLDADDIIRPTMLEKTVQLLEANPDIAIAYTDIEHFGAVNRTIQAAEFDAAKIPINNQLNVCSLYRREAWERCGGYNSSTIGYEDWDFWVSCTAHGSQARRIPESLLLYRVKETSQYTHALQRDAELRARIVLNHPQLYPPKRLREARRIVNSRPEPQVPGAPLVSVIVPTHNRPELLCDALRSILSQTLQDFEIIVVNDAGVDVGPWIRSLDEPERIRLLRHPRNRGLAAARNTGLTAARGKYIAYLDDDDLFYPHHLATLVDAAETTGHAVVYSDGCQASYSEREGGTVVDRSVVHSGGFEFQDLLVRNQIPVLCVLHRRSCIDKVGGFDESFATHEDWDMWIRLFYHHSHAHIAQTTCEYRVQETGGSLTNTKRPDFYRTMKIIHRRYRHWARALPGTRMAQKKTLASLARELYRSGRPVETWGRIRCLLRAVSHATKPLKPGVVMVHTILQRLHTKVMKRLARPVTLIHTPKCAGTFIQQAYCLHERPWIRTIGHGCMRDTAPKGRRHVFVGLIREPVDWYASYVAFCRRSLSLEPQGDENFPATHPISIFSDNGRRSLAATLDAMSDRSLLEKLCADRVEAKIYAREIPDVYEFMLRTGTGFWTWTMMHHFADTTTAALRTAADVREQAASIARKVSFIRQHRLDEDMQSILRLPPPRQQPRMNASERTAADVPCPQTLTLASRLDGDAYASLGRQKCFGSTVAASREAVAERSRPLLTAWVMDRAIVRSRSA